MTPDPTPTDEELAEMEWVFPPPRTVGTGIGFYGARPVDADAYKRACANVPRLIAALRASREEVERLRQELDGRERFCAEFHDDQGES